jgi:uncharacterized membrane protein
MGTRKPSAWILSFLPLFITLSALPVLPDTVPLHYESGGTVDRYGSKYELLYLPIMSILMGFIWIWAGRRVTRNENQKNNNLKVIFWNDIVVSLIFSVVTLSVLYMAYSNTTNIYNADTDMLKIISVCLGFGWILIGNILPKCKSNRMVGIRTKWTLASAETWHRTHRFGGRVLVVGGVLTALLCMFVFDGLAALIFYMCSALAMVAMIVVYSYLNRETIPS